MIWHYTDDIIKTAEDLGKRRRDRPNTLSLRLAGKLNDSLRYLAVEGLYLPQ